MPTITRWTDKNGDLFRMGREKSHYYTETIAPAYSPNAGRVTRTYCSKATAQEFDPDPYGELEVSHTYTAADVLDACFAQSCAEIAAAEQHTSAEAVATADCESYDENNVLDVVETKRLRAAMLARLENGQNVLDEAKLVQSRRFVNGCARYHLRATISPVVLLSAGHIATSEASREATLRAK